MKKRFLSIIMAAAMVLSLLPMSALAAEGTEGTMTQAALAAAIKAAPAGGTVTLTGDVDVTAPIIITKELTLDLNGKKILNSGNIWNEAGYNWSLISVRAGGDLTIKGSGMLQAKEDDCYAVDVMDGGICTIENGTFVGNIHAVYVLKGTLVVNGGTFSVQQKYTDPSKAYEFVLNCYDGHYKNGSASITVYGGTFVGFNPRACGAETAGKDTNFCAPGRVVEVTGGSGEELSTYIVKALDAGNMAVIPETSPEGGISASLEGTYTPNTTSDNIQDGGEGQPTGAVENNTVTVDFGTTGGTTTASLNVAADTVSSLANNNATLTVKSDAGTLDVDNDALQSIVDSADENSAVTLSITKGTETADSVTYTLTATDAAGNNVFEQGSSNGTITVTVDYSGTDKPSVYYLGENGTEKVDESLVKLDAENNLLTWTVSHFSDWLIQDGDNAISYQATGGTLTFTNDFSNALDAVNESGGTITVHEDVTDNFTSVISISKDVTINGSGTIAITAPDGSTAHCIDILNEGSLTLEGVTLDITGTTDDTYNHGGYGIDINHGGKLTLDGAVVNFSGLEAATCSSRPSGTDAGVTAAAIELKNGAKITANTIDGNFSNGGIWTVTDGSSIEINGCGSHGFSADKITVSGANSTVSVTGADYRGISINGTYLPNGTDAALTVEEGGTVNVTDCGDSTRPAVYLANGKYNAALVVKEGATLNVTATKDGKNDTISLSDDSSVKNVTSGDITGSVKNPSDVAIVATIDNGGSYTTLDAAVKAIGSNTTINLIGDGTLTKAIDSGKTLVVKSGAALTVDLTQEDVLKSTGTISVEDGGKLIAKTGTENTDVINMIGDSTCNVQLDSGKADISMADLASGKISIKFVGAKASVPAGGYWTLTMGVGTKDAKMDVTLDGTSSLTVASSKGLRIANGSKLTMESGSQLIVNSGALLRVGSEGEIAGDGTITNSGTVTLHKGDAADKTAKVTAITLAGGGAVYSQFEVTDGKIGPSGNVSHSTGSYTVAGVTENDGSTLIQFTERYTYYTPSSSSGGSTRYTVTAPTDVANGSVKVSPTRASYNQTVTVTVTPDEGYQLASIAVTDRSGNTITLERGNANQYTFKMPRGAVSIAVTFEEIAPWTSPYVDVTAGDWFYDAVEYVVDNSLMTGTSSTTFEPDAQLTRGMMATVLWAMSGGPVVNYAMDYTDVSDGDWYAEAVRWATSTGVVTGMGDGTYEPNAPITREQMMVMLYAYAVRAGYDVDQGGMSAREFDDYGEISGWAVTAMEWAVNTGMIGGKPGNLLDPTGSATRAEVATILRNYHQTFVAE